ncbi:MAG: glycosyltransferase [Candidatus Thalassarchaeum sp.]|jgi:glycosyltransferase involved in cell wall biosynthesis|nr:glycosyltransferase [Candidatus Thalassarchaeum sp.]MDP7004183.1 glycosyltransferase [Candidatus Thalassarchaeaceae archaeon]
MEGGSDKPVLLVAKGTFEALGGGERDLMRVLPALNELFSVRMATIHPVPELSEICVREGIRLIAPDQPWQLPKGSLSTVLDTGRSTASKAWSSSEGLAEAVSVADALHLVSGDGSLPLMDHVPSGLRTHLHLLEPHRGLYEDTLHRQLDGTPKRSLALTESLLSRARHRDQRMMRGLMERPGSMVSSNSSFSAQRAKDVYGIDAGVLWPCVDYSEFPADPSGDEESPYTGAEGGYVVSVGRASWAKGTWEVVSMLQGTGLSLAHVGGGDEGSIAMLRSHAEASGVGLWVAPRLPSPNLVSLMREARAIVSMAHSESFGLSPIEAFAVGTPALFVDDGGFRDTIVDGVNGRLLPRDDAQAWRAALKEAEEDSTRERWAAAGRARIEELDLSPEAHARRLWDILY